MNEQAEANKADKARAISAWWIYTSLKYAIRFDYQRGDQAKRHPPALGDTKRPPAKQQS